MSKKIFLKGKLPVNMIQTHTHIYFRQTDRQIDRQADRQTDRQTGRQTDRQTD